MMERLPPSIQEKAKALFKVFEANPSDPQLENEDIYDSRKGRHRKGSRSVSITRRYRAVYVQDHGKDGNDVLQNCWYWCGSHEDYNNFIGSK